MARGNAGSGISTVREDIFEDVSGDNEIFLSSDNPGTTETSFARTDLPTPTRSSNLSSESDGISSNLQDGLSEGPYRALGDGDKAAETGSSDFFTAMDGDRYVVRPDNDIFISSNTGPGAGENIADLAGGDDHGIGELARADAYGEAISPSEATPTSGAATTSYSISGQNYIDSLYYSQKWGGALGTGTSLTYSFGTSSSVYASGYGSGEPTTGFGEFSADQKTATRNSLDYYAKVANLTFTEVTDSSTVAGDLRFAKSSVPSTAWAYLPSGSPLGGDVWVGPSASYDDMSEGTYGFQTLLHEIGHALGLSHPHDGSVIGTSANDWLGVSLMSYKSFEGAANGYRQDYYPTTPMYNDIAALQRVYGANTTTTAGDDTYSWTTGANIYQTIWDAGGTDTIDWSNQSTSAIINLNAGQWNELGPQYRIDYSVYPYVYSSQTLKIAENTVIENATGGSAADTLTGNTVANLLNGGAGNDTLSGGAGDDTMTGGTGNDSLTGGAGNDIFSFASGFGIDVIYDFTAGVATDDLIDLSYTGITDFGALYGNIADVSGNAVITIGSDTITINGVVKSQLNADDFVGVSGGGSNNDDTLAGTSSNDIIYGLGGNDTLTGLGGNDFIYGGTGNDSLDGGTGTDNLYGGAGDDTYVIDDIGDRVYENAAEGTDTVQSSINHLMQANFENLTLTGTTATSGIGNTLANVITGNSADNILLGRAGNDTMSGGTGNDELYGNEDDDTLNGDAGDDRLDGNIGNDTLNGGDGNDRLNGQDGNDILNGDAGADILFGHAGADTLNGGADNDSLFGGTGNDSLDGGTGSDNLRGEAGDDTYVIDDIGDRVYENAAEGTDTVQSSINHLMQANFENLTLTGTTATSGIGNTLANVITGNSADNILLGRAGNDTMSGGTGNDELYGNEDDDTLNGDAGDDRLDGNIGNDTLNGGDGNDRLNGQDGNDILNGDAGADILFGHAGTDTLNGGADNDSLFGGADNDALDGGTGDDVLYGGTGDDTLDGGIGADFMKGETGDDTYVIDDIGDRVYENAAEGTDTVQSSINHLMQANFENLTLTGTTATSGIGNTLANVITGNSADNILLGRAGNDTMSGGTGNDELYGNEDDDTLNGDAGDDRLDGNIGNDTLNGGDGNDRLNGQDGNDILNGDAGADILFGHAGTDTLNGGADNDSLFGGADNDALNGGTGDDVLYGGTGNDTITGGDGIDRLVGEAGSDQFIYAAMSEAGDMIVDFEVGAAGDALNLSTLLSNLGYAGGNAMGDGWVQSLQSGSNTVVQIDINGGGDNFTTLTTLQTITETDLTVENWIL